MRVHKQRWPLPDNTRSAASTPHRETRANLVLSLLFLLYTLDYVDRQVITALFPFIKADLGLSDTQTGLFVSVLYWSIVALTLPASVVVDRWSRRYSIAFMVALWSLATGAAAFLKTFPALLATRLGVGVGEAGYAPGGMAMISALFPAERRSRVLGLWNAAIPLGSILGVAVGGLVAARWGWHRAFGIVSIPGLMVGVLFAVFARDYRTVKLEVPADTATGARKMKPREILFELASKPSLLLTYAALAGNSFLQAAYLSWMPTYFHRYWDASTSRASLLTAIVLIAPVAGAPLGGVLADRWQRHRDNARPLVAGIGSLLSAALFAAAFGMRDGPAQLIVLALGSAASALYISGAMALSQDVVHPGMWAMSWSLGVVVQYLLGSSLGPLVTGAISDWRDLRTAFRLVPAASALAGVLFLAAARLYVRDKSRVAKVEVVVAKESLTV